MPDRIFTEEEVKEIIRRASEQQAEAAERQEARRHGLTLDDLERLGAEVGLDPTHLRRAADEVRTGRRAVAETDTQTDTHVIVERRIDRPFTPEAWEDTVVLLRQSFGISQGMWFGASGEGRVEQVGRAHEWVHMSQLGVETRVSASERGGQTRLLLSQRVGMASPKVEGYGYGALVGVVAGGIGIATWVEILGQQSSFLVFLIIALAAAFLAAPIITRLDRGWRQKKQRGLKELAADIEQIFEAAAPRSVAHAASSEADPRAAEADPTPDGRIDLDSLPDEAGDARSAERSRTRS